MNTNNIPHIGLDIETLSLRPTAAITAIAAKTFFFDGTIAESHSMTLCVDATSCAMHGLAFDPATIDWWHSQPYEARRFFLDKPAIKIGDALSRLETFYNEVQKVYDCRRVLVWVQGTDFDIAVLRNAYRTVFTDDETSIPWPHDCVRDARTYILSNLSFLHSIGFFQGSDPPYDPAHPYDVLFKHPNWVPHRADSDVLQMIHNVTGVSRLMREALLPPH